MKYYLAIDLGASSGRHIVGYRNDNNEIILDEVYRFKNEMINDPNYGLIWDVNYLFEEVKKGIKKALEKYKVITSMSIDTWGVDYCLLNGNETIYPCYAYRNTRTKSVISKVHNNISFSRLYELTGIQFQEFNTIYQLYCDKISGRLAKADDFLLIPDYLIYKLTGIKAHEATNLSTTGLLDAKTKDYNEEIISKLGLPKKIFKNIDKCGTKIGHLKPEIVSEVGGDIEVVLCASHDTASAVEALNIDSSDIAYISSGTWSLLGAKNDVAVTSNKALNANYSNEHGPNYYRVQKNIMGMWIIQGLSKELKMDFPKMVEAAKNSNYNYVFDVNDSIFLSSLNMKQDIYTWFVKHNITPPTKDEDYINSVYLSLAESYKIAIDELAKILNKDFSKLIIIGGGAKNEYLNSLTKNRLKMDVLALPIEASALGNILIQMEVNYGKKY